MSIGQLLLWGLAGLFTPLTHHKLIVEDRENLWNGASLTPVCCLLTNRFLAGLSRKVSVSTSFPQSSLLEHIIGLLLS